MSKINEKLQERASLVDEAREIHQGDGEVSASDEERFDDLMDEAEEIREEVEEMRNRKERLRRHEEELAEREERIQRDPNVPEDVKDMDVERVEELENRAFKKYWFSNENLTEEERQFLYPAPRSGDGPMEHARGANSMREGYDKMRERRAGQMQTGSSGAGGTFVPPGFQREIIETQKAFGGLENVARTIRTPRGNDLDIPTADDTGNQGSIVGEASTIGNTTSVPTGNVTMESVKYQSGPVKYSLEQDQDSFTDMNQFLRQRLGTRIGRVFASHIAQRSSTESSGPHGITNASTGAVSIVQGTTTLTPGALRDLIHSVDPAYRGRQNVAFVLNDNTLKNWAKLEDADGRPLWQPSLQQGTPDEILGFPLQIDQNIPTMSSTATSPTKPVFFGDMGSYAVRRVMDMRMFDITERFIEEGNLAVIAFQRSDGRALFHSTVAAEQKPIRAILATTS